jgi:hypothetical protein
MVFDMIKDLVPTKSYRKSRVDGDFLVVMSPSMDIYFLNCTSHEIVSQIDNNKTISQISYELLKKYDVEEHVLQRDIVALFRSLQWKQILKLKKPTQP